MADVASHHRPVRAQFQFSLRLLLFITAVVAVSVATLLSLYRQREATERAMLFRQAVQNGDLASIDRLLKSDPRLAHGRRHGSVSSSQTALQSALITSFYQPQVVDRILQEQPDVNETSSSGKTALHIAVEMNNLVEVRRLARLGAKLDAMDDDGSTPLHIAVQADLSGRLLKLLVELGADPNSVPSDPPPDWKSPLSVAAESRDREIVAQLLDARAQVNARDARGRTALHFALTDDHRRHDVATLLVERGADLAERDHQGLIPGEQKDGLLSSAAMQIWWERIERLIQSNGVSTLRQMLDRVPQVLSSRDKEGQTLLHHACFANRLPALAKHLIDTGASLNARDQRGQTPFHVAAQEHNHQVLRLLLAAGADIRRLDNAGTSVLDAAFLNFFPQLVGQETIELIRQAGHGPTVLYSTATGDLDLLEELTRGERELLDRQYLPTGFRPLHAAVVGEQSNVVEWLLARGVDPDPRLFATWSYTREDTPVMMALNRNFADIAIRLIQNGANVNRNSSRAFYPLHHAISRDCDPSILESLLAHGAEYRYETAQELAKDPKLRNGPRYLELLDPATDISNLRR